MKTATGYIVTIKGKRVSGARFCAGSAQAVWYDKHDRTLWSYEDASRIKNGFPAARLQSA